MRCRLLAQWAPSKLMLLDHFHETCKFDQNLIIYGVAAVIGHIYPIFYKFKGGKGVATYLGVYIAFTIANPIGSELFENLYFLYLNIPTLALFYFIIIKISRVSAVASLTTVLISNSLLIIH